MAPPPLYMPWHCTPLSRGHRAVGGSRGVGMLACTLHAHLLDGVDVDHVPLLVGHAVHGTPPVRQAVSRSNGTPDETRGRGEGREGGGRVVSRSTDS